MSDELWRALLDPSAPLPTGWPVGALGAFLLFCVPIGGGIPAGVLMARHAGVPPPMMAALYALSDVVLAFTFEPVLVLLRWIGRFVPPLGRLARAIGRQAARTGTGGGRARGPLGLVLVSFGVDPMTGRAAAAVAGHGFVKGWAIAIAGDMLYFAVLMASTLWLQGAFGDERVTVGTVLLLMLVLPSLARRLGGRGARETGPPSPPSRRP